MKERRPSGGYIVKTLLAQRNKSRPVIFMAVFTSFIFSAIGLRFNSFTTPSTDDAYISGNEISISSQVSGLVTHVNLTRIDLVRKGDILVRVDNTDALINYKKAEHKLAETTKVTKELYDTLCLNNTHIMKAQTAYQRALYNYNRRTQSKEISAKDLQQALKSVNRSKASLDAAMRKYHQNLQLLQTSNIAQQQAISQAAEELREASVALKHTEVRSPVTGYVVQRNVHPGAVITPGQVLISIVPADQIWINANFKAAQLSDILIGQKVSIITDQYGRNVIFAGLVEGFNLASDTAPFAQSALSGGSNLSNDMQQIPVRIAIDPIQMSQYPLRIGLSTQVTLLGGYSHLAAY